MILGGDPIAAAAVGEFVSPGLRDQFLAWPTDSDPERMQAIMASDHSTAVFVPVFNANPDLAEPPQLATQAYIFEPQPDDALKSTFLDAYGDHIDVVQKAYDQTETEQGGEAKKETLAKVREALLLGAAVSLSGDDRRLLGGFSLVATKKAPKEYMSYAFAVRTLLEQCQFLAREAVLQDVLLAEQPEELRQSWLVMQSGKQLETLAHNIIVRKMLPKAEIARILGIELGKEPET